MAFVIGLFEDIQHVDVVLDRLDDAGFTADQVSILSKKNITEEDTEALYDKRAAASGSFIGALGGGYVGMAAGAAALAIPGIGLGIATGVLGTVLATTLGGAAGAAAGAYAGHKLVPAIMDGFDVSEEDAHFYAEAVKREGILVAVETTEANEAEARKIFENSRAINIRERRQELKTEGWERFDPADHPHNADTGA